MNQKLMCTNYFQAILVYLNPTNGVLYSNYFQTHQYISWCLVTQRGKVMPAIFQASERVQLRLRSSAMLRGKRCSSLATFRRPKLLCSVGNQLHTYAGQHPRRTKASTVHLGLFTEVITARNFPVKIRFDFTGCSVVIVPHFGGVKVRISDKIPTALTEACCCFLLFVQAIVRRMPRMSQRASFHITSKLIIHTNQPITLFSIGS